MQVEGRNAVIELLRSKREIKKIFLQAGINVQDSKIHEIIQRARNRKIFIENVSKKRLDQMSDTDTHQGVIAQVEFRYERLSVVLENNEIHHLPTTLIYIREAQYEQNIGAIARSVEAAGFTGIVLPPNGYISATAMRISTGAINNLKVIRDSLFNTIKVCKTAGMQVTGIEVTTEDYYYNVDLTPDTLFIIGGEDKPLSDEIVKKCDNVVKIPMRGKINSLNMSVACSIILFDKIRQENTSKS